jgi:hypothetical protein
MPTTIETTAEHFSGHSRRIFEDLKNGLLQAAAVRKRSL